MFQAWSWGGDMNRVALAELLAEAAAPLRAELLAHHAALADARLAQELRAIYFDVYSSDLRRAAGAAHALADLASCSTDPQVAAIALWIEGLAALQIEGRLEYAIERVDAAAVIFSELGQEHAAANTRIGKIFALARLGRYDEAVEVGLQARATLLAYGDNQAVGRIELNLGNLADRRGRHDHAIAYYQAARERFSAAGDQRMLAYVHNGLANIFSQQYQFSAAAALYEQALTVAEAANLEVTRAEIECNLGIMALCQGRYDQALALLEHSRRRYAALAMPHESAIAELELADAYMELNLIAEAAAIYGPVTDTFGKLGMRAEQARTLLNHGRACLQLGALDMAWALLAEAGDLYAAEGNPVGAAMVALAEARLYHREGDYARVAVAALRAEPPLVVAGIWDQLLALRWLCGEAARLSGLPTAARQLRETLAEAEHHGVGRIVLRCRVSLGRLAVAAGDYATAEEHLLAAAERGEALRVPLPADELRTALAAETASPFRDLVQLCLADPGGGRLAEAFGYAERGRARAMIEMLGSNARLPHGSHDSADPAALARMNELRTELNWLYSSMSRRPDDAAGPSALAALYEAAREREVAVSELRRRITHTAGAAVSVAGSFDLAGLSADLGATTVLVEYVELANELVAFVVSDGGVAVVRDLGPIAAVEAELARFRFQIGTLSYGAARVRSHLESLTGRTRAHLHTLYELLVRPLAPLIGDRRLVVVPTGLLHYLPFHALHDGAYYLVERREVCCAPGTEMLRRCLARPRTALRRALLVGLSDAETPQARSEAAALAPGFAEAVTLLDEAATLAALSGAAPGADLLHLACHGRFRPDNPLFSALRLADGWLTVHDIYSLDLNCQLVTLSACETGASSVAPGDELLGLARGFFLAGAPALIVSQWRVDDEATAELMAALYEGLRAGAQPAAALRNAQRATLERRPHPFFWASFGILGRW